MQIPKYFEYGDEDEIFSSITPERQLYLAVFANAIVDLQSRDPLIREKTIRWFKGEPAIISFKEIKQMFNFSASRINALNRMIEGREQPRKVFRMKYRNPSKQSSHNRVFVRG